MESYDKAIQIKPNFAEAYYNRGNAFLKLKKIESAIASYDKAIQIEPNSAEIYYHRSQALQQVGKLDDALQGYSKAIQIEPDHNYLLGKFISSSSGLTYVSSSSSLMNFCWS